MPPQVRLLTADDWQAWRDIRLRALADSPDSFRPTLEDERAMPDEWWQDIVGSTAENERGNLWLADQDGAHVGMAFATIDEDHTTVYVGAMWVAPEARRNGIGALLLAAAIKWGRAAGTVHAELWVTEANTDAVAFYESRGYLPTNATDHLREGSNLVVRKLHMEL